MVNWKKVAIFAGGTLFGSVGIRLLTSQDAKHVYAHLVAAGLRVRECVMSTVTRAQENAGDILADALDINTARDTAEEVVEDAPAEAETQDSGETPSEV